MSNLKSFIREKDYTGEKFGRFTIIKDNKNICGDRIVVAQCECGNIRTKKLTKLTNGVVLSCGCLAKELLSKRQSTHRLTKHPLYSVWFNILRRCFDNKHDNYPSYGARGITICQEWKENFKSFYDWCILNGWKRGLQIDRKNNNGNYEPSNCRIATPKQNARNRRNSWIIEYKGKNKHIIEWCDLFNKKYHLVRSRMYAGWNFEKAMEL